VHTGTNNRKQRNKILHASETQIKGTHKLVLTKTKYKTIGATTVGTGGDSPTFRLGTNNILVPQLLGRSFKKARNFTAISRQNAGFSN